MISNEQEQLNDLFNLYYNNAKKNYDEGNLEGAKRHYLLAAETMLKQAKISNGDLRLAMIERAKRIVTMANSLTITDANATKRGTRTVAEGSANARNSSAESRNSDEQDGKLWQAAEVPCIGFDDVIGLSDVKQSITTRMINPLKYPEMYAAFNKKAGGGVLLYGPPGTGKTMIAKAIAHEVGATFYCVKGSDIMSKWVGDSEKNISSLFETARKDRLAIIFIDEMDSLFGERSKDTHNDKRVNEFLQQIDGFVGKNPNLLLLGATNRPWDIDSAAVRSGRFSEKIYVPLPDSETRLFMVKKYLRNCPLSEDIDYGALAEMTEGFSGADIEELADRAKEVPLQNSIVSGRQQPITMQDIVNAIRKIVLVNDDRTIKKYEEFAGLR